jgi:hypothetical protein
MLFIVVTAPVFQFDKSWLNTDARSNTAKASVQQEGKRENPQQQQENSKKVRQKNLCENCDHNMKLELFYIKNHEATQREGESVHLLLSIVVTAPVFHFDTSWLNSNAL